MTAKSRQIDHGNRHIKMLLRKAMLHFINPQTALDLFAGVGEISSQLYQDFKEIHCVEKDPKKFSCLEHNMSNISGPGGHRPRVHLHCMDNMEFLETRVNEIPDINLVDFDAYGCPNPQIKKFFTNYSILQPTLIFATDGGKISCMRGGRCSPDLYSSRSHSSCHWFGYSPQLVKAYEIIIQEFWREMADAYAFRILAFRIFWKKRKQVAYYGILISPS